MKKRTRSRELALQFLYQLDLRGDDLLAEAKDFLRNEERDAETQRFALRLVEGTFEHWDEIDKTIQGVAQNWNIARMAVVDRNVLRLAAWELIFTDTPGPVHIDGTHYDLNAAGAELAELLAAQLAGGILSFTDAAGESWSRGDASAALLELATRFRARAAADAATTGAGGVGSVSINASEQRAYGLHPGAGWLAP